MPAPRHVRDAHTSCLYVWPLMHSCWQMRSPPAIFAVAPDAVMLAPRSPDAPVAVMLAVSRPRERSTAGPVLHVGSAVALGVHLSVHCVSFDDDRAVYCSFQKQTSYKNKLRLQG